MFKNYQVIVVVDNEEEDCAEEYQVNVKASCIKNAIDGAMNILYDNVDIYNKEILKIEARKMTYIEYRK